MSTARRLGEIHFPGGEADLTSVCHPGENIVLSLLVVAMPLKEALLSYQDTNSARKLRATVPRRGLCGDVFLESTPTGPRINDIKIDTSVRRAEITFDAGDRVASPPTVNIPCIAKVTDERQSRPTNSRASHSRPAIFKEGRFAFTEKWKPDRQIWDIDTPQNHVRRGAVARSRIGGELLDHGESVRFGFREFWIDGRDFFLNGTRIFLSAVPLGQCRDRRRGGDLRRRAGKLGAAQKLRRQFRLHAQLRLRARLAPELRRNSPGRRRRRACSSR